jgi:hypothetical protein
MFYHGRLWWYGNNGLVCGIVVIASTACNGHDLEVCGILRSAPAAINVFLVDMRK